MLNMMQAAELVLTLAMKSRQKEVDVVVERNELLEVNILNGEVEKIEESTSLGLGVRVLDNGRTGLASTERLDTDSISKTFKNACENSKLQDRTEVEMLDPPEKIPDSLLLELYNPELEKLNTDELSEFGFLIEDSVKSADKRVVSIPYLGVSKGYRESLLFSSKGIINCQKSNEVSAWCGPLLQDKNSRKSGFHYLNRRQLDLQEGARIGTESVKKALEMLNASSIPGGKFPVVFDEHVAPKLMGMYFGAFSAESAQKGMSRLQGKLGERISIPGLNLLDDPHYKGASRSCYLDAEGCLTEPLIIVEDGVFKNFLYNVESAKKEKKFSTGHAARTYTSGISTRSHNLVWPKGSYSLEKLCSINKKCLLITKLDGQAGCDPISGDISIGIQGFLIENGIRIQPFEGVTLSGNFFKMLLNIKGTGDTYQPEITNCFIPALLIEGLSISS